MKSLIPEWDIWLDALAEISSPRTAPAVQLSTLLRWQHSTHRTRALISDGITFPYNELVGLETHRCSHMT